MRTLTDDDLLTAARRGDTVAREQLVDRHLGTVRAVCASRLASRHDVADAVQDTFERALTRLDQVEDPEALAGWLRAIAVRVCADQGRRAARTVCLPDVGGDAPCPSLAPPDVVVVEEERAGLVDRLLEMGERDRRALWLRDALGLPVSDVAVDLGLTEGSTRVLLTRARHRLRAAYHGVGALAAAGWLRLRQRLAAVVSPAELGAATAAQVALVVAVVVGVGVGVGAPARPATPASPGAAASTERTRPVPDEVTAATAEAPTAAAVTDGSDRATGAGPASPSRPPAVEVGDTPPAEPEAVEVSAEDGDGEVVELMVFLGDTADGLPVGSGGDDGEPDDGAEAEGDEDRIELFGGGSDGPGQEAAGATD